MQNILVQSNVLYNKVDLIKNKKNVSRNYFQACVI